MKKQKRILTNLIMMNIGINDLKFSLKKECYGEDKHKDKKNYI